MSALYLTAEFKNFVKAAEVMLSRDGTGEAHPDTDYVELMLTCGINAMEQFCLGVQRSYLGHPIWSKLVKYSVRRAEQYDMLSRYVGLAMSKD